MEVVENLISNKHSHENEVCRLCGESVNVIFSKKILGKYDIQYFECPNCLSVQTEKPYWLSEAYAHSNLSVLDTGVAQRNLSNLAASFLIAKLVRAKNIIDFGGGDGLLCRLLRDYKINCYVKDKYARPSYCQGFLADDFLQPDLLIGFEVLEHYANPSEDLVDLFSNKPSAILLSTEIYKAQSADWWYFAPESGQHIFFYSTRGLEYIGKKYNYNLEISGNLILFIKSPTFFKKMISKILLKSWVLRLMRAIIVLMPTPGVLIDYSMLIKKPNNLN